MGSLKYNLSLINMASADFVLQGRRLSVIGHKEPRRSPNRQPLTETDSLENLYNYRVFSGCSGHSLRDFSNRVKTRKLQLLTFRTSKCGLVQNGGGNRNHKGYIVHVKALKSSRVNKSFIVLYFLSSFREAPRAAR